LHVKNTIVYEDTYLGEIQSCMSGTANVWKMSCPWTEEVVDSSFFSFCILVVNHSSIGIFQISSVWSIKVLYIKSFPASHVYLPSFFLSRISQIIPLGTYSVFRSVQVLLSWNRSCKLKMDLFLPFDSIRKLSCISGSTDNWYH